MQELNVTAVVPDVATFAKERWGISILDCATERELRDRVFENVFLKTTSKDFVERMMALDVLFGMNPTFLQSDEARVCREFCLKEFAPSVDDFWEIVRAQPFKRFSTLQAFWRQKDLDENDRYRKEQQEAHERYLAEQEQRRLDNQREKAKREHEERLKRMTSFSNLESFLAVQKIVRKTGESNVNLRQRAFVELFLRSNRMAEEVRFVARAEAMEVLIGFRPKYLRIDDLRWAERFCDRNMLQSKDSLEEFASTWQERMPSAVDLLKRLGLSAKVIGEAVAA